MKLGLQGSPLRDQGILVLPDRRHDKEITDYVLDKAHKFDQDDEFSSKMLGRKDYVTIGGNKDAPKWCIRRNHTE